MELTDPRRDLANDTGYLHDCIHVRSTRTSDVEPYQTIPYCFTEPVRKSDTQNTSYGDVLTFVQLAEQHSTAEQLYRWSAPIDIVERYQSYLIERSSRHDSVELGQQLYYNCTPPWFGPYCQYSLDIYQSDNFSSLNEMIADFYRQNYEPVELTCYTHLECVHATRRTCLDWSDVCDGYVDCQGGADEALCWELTSNRCGENQRRCRNGQCIPSIFWYDDREILECLDGSDTYRQELNTNYEQNSNLLTEPTFVHEDIQCSRFIIGKMKATSTCKINRWSLLYKGLFFERPSLVSETCWLAVRCRLLRLVWQDPRCTDLCSNQTCEDWIAQTCTEMWNVPAGTVAFGHIFFLYTREAFLTTAFVYNVPPAYICYDDRLCDGLDPTQSLISFQNATCRRPEDFPLEFLSQGISRGDWFIAYGEPVLTHLEQCNTINGSKIIDCDRLMMYQCMNSSKCISRERICDEFSDCPNNDDEDCLPVNNSCTKYSSAQLFHCVFSNFCLSTALVGDGYCQCSVDQYDFCEDEDFGKQIVRRQLSFQTICDGYTELLPTLINGRDETDETECEYWSCRNIYTRCDGFWNCRDGADELDCPSAWSTLHCPAQHHPCVSPNTSDFMCLPIEKANDGVSHCLGGTDEPQLCRSIGYARARTNFYCIYSKEGCLYASELCRFPTCADRTNLQFCTSNVLGTLQPLCDQMHDGNRSSVENFFCERPIDENKPQRIYFALKDRSTSSHKDRTQDIIDAHLSHIRSPEPPVSRLYQQQCHRGLVIHQRLNTINQSTAITCMCPPSYYGDRCQFQNQRVSLTIQLEALSIYRRTPLVLVITLIDDSLERTIHSYRQLTFLYIRDCRRKTNIYLVYSTRPKNATRNYFIHIDAHDHTSLAHRGSILIPVKHSFMPVNRIAVRLDIIRSDVITKSCLDRPCQHGHCHEYGDSVDRATYCRCNEGWSGKYCHLQHQCQCSRGSICAGVSADNRSICVCPLNKWGPRCLLARLECQSEYNDTCHGRGRCVPNDETSDESDPFTCICQRGFSGRRCEIDDSQLILSFHRRIDVPQTILVHFIQVVDDGPPEIGVTFKTILAEQNTVSIPWSYPWHLAFLDLFEQKYYLIAARAVYNRSAVITRAISPLDRCPHVRKLLNKSFAYLPLIRRIKYYHTICRDAPAHVTCFFDEVHMCLCQDYERRRLANCLEFNHTRQHDCAGRSYCENGAQCVQDRLICPRLSVCICPRCFYGLQCQFSSSGFDLSLDGILGYHIQPHASISQQPALVKISVALTMVILVGSLVSGICSAITFSNNEARKTGSGTYLLISSLNTIFTMSVFGLKFWILIVSQIAYVTKRPLLYAQCLSLDFLVKVGLSLDQWLAACVSIERALVALYGLKFSRKSSKQSARFVVTAVAMVIISTMIQDPIHRRLLEENDDNVDQKRIWCIVQYSNTVQRYNSAILMVHVIAPVVINLLATLIIIVKTAQQRIRIQRNQPRSYGEVLRRQLQQMQHQLIAPVVFIILAIPRLVISFTSGCMKSGGAVWVFLIGYLVSFAPLMFTFLVFVYSAKSYKQIFQKKIRHYRRTALLLFSRVTRAKFSC